MFAAISTEFSPLGNRYARAPEQRPVVNSDASIKALVSSNHEGSPDDVGKFGGWAVSL